MKLLTLLTLSLVTISTSRSTSNDHYLERTVAQLNRLSALRKSQQEKTKVTTKKWPDIFDVILNNNNLKMDNLSDQNILFGADAMRRIDELAEIAYKIAKDPDYSETMQERIKRSGSGDFISGIASKVVNGVIGSSGSLSSGSSGGSSEPHAIDSYGAPVHPYEEFGIWDFKKAIINTLIQALKALAGGVIAVKGHLIKGGGFIVQTTGRVISSAGEAASSLGVQIAKNAVISHGKPGYEAPGYSYDAPPYQDAHYDGPPPSPDATYTQHTVHHHYGAPSDADPANEPGVIIVKPVSNEVHHHDYQQDHDENHHDDEADHHPPPSSSDGSFGGVKNTETITKLVGLVTGTSGPLQNNQHDEHVNYNTEGHEDHPPLPSVSSHHHNSDSQHALNHPPPLSSDYNNHFYQHDQQQNQPDHHPQSLLPLGNSNEFPISQDYLSAYQQIQSLINPHLQLPTIEPQGFIGQTSNYGGDSSFESLKIPILNHQYQNTLEMTNFGVHELPTDYGSVLHHRIGMASIYPNLKRAGFISPHLNKINSRSMIMKRRTNYRIKDVMLHRV